MQGSCLIAVIGFGCACYLSGTLYKCCFPVQSLPRAEFSLKKKNKIKRKGSVKRRTGQLATLFKNVEHNFR